MNDVLRYIVTIRAQQSARPVIAEAFKRIADEYLAGCGTCGGKGSGQLPPESPGGER